MPKGFGNATPGGGAGADKRGASSSSSGKSDGDKGGGTSGSKKEGGADKDKGGAGGSGGDSPNLDPVATGLAAIALTYALYTLFGAQKPAGHEISWQEFRNTYLATGMVDRLEVINKEYVRVHLRNAPNFAFLEGSQPSSAAAAAAHGFSYDPRSDPAASLLGSSGDASAALFGAAVPPDREGELRRALEDARTHKHLYFRIGSVESFERQLEDAQLDLRVRPRDFVLVRHVNETDFATRIMAVTPYLLMFAVYALMFRMMSGGGIGIGGGGGMGGGGGGNSGINRVFSIGRARPAVVNKDSKVKVTFKDVAGCDEAKAEIMEFVQVRASRAWRGRACKRAASHVGGRGGGVCVARRGRMEVIVGAGLRVCVIIGQ
jgi:AFG3 family protein